MFRAAGPLKHAGDRFQPGLSTLLAPLAGVTKSLMNPPSARRALKATHHVDQNHVVRDRAICGE